MTRLIDSLRQYSTRLVIINPVVLVTICVSLCFFIYSLFFLRGLASNTYLIPSFVSFLWSASLYSVINIFPNVPEKPSKDQIIFVRLKIAVKRFFYNILAVVFCAVSIAALYTGYKLLSVWYGSNT